MNLENILLSERSQAQENILFDCIFIVICRIGKLTETKSGFVIAWRYRLGGGWRLLAKEYQISFGVMKLIIVMVAPPIVNALTTLNCII